MRWDGPQLLTSSLGLWLDVACGGPNEKGRGAMQSSCGSFSFVVVSPLARLAAVDVCWNVEACDLEDPGALMVSRISQTPHA